MPAHDARQCQLSHTEVGAGLTPQQLAPCDTVADPEDRPDPVTGLRAIDRFTDFMRFLAPPPRAPLAPDVARQGEAVFGAIGCAACHVPALVTGPGAAPGLADRIVAAFSDFLLHDVGTEDGIAQGPAGPNEIRTAWPMPSVSMAEKPSFRAIVLNARICPNGRLCWRF